jgi:N-acylneuraminate cytidylyltransferase
VSTDSEDIARTARQWGAEAPFLRPADISQAGSKEIDAFTHALGWLRDHEGYEPDLVVKLPPTSPFRKPETVDRAIDLLIADPSADSVRGVIACSEHPFKMWTVEGKRLRSFVPLDQKPKDAHTFSYQSLPEVFVQTASIDVVRASVVWGKHSVLGDEIIPLVMPPAECVDINEPLDAAYAAFLLEKGLVAAVDPVKENRA